MKITSVLTRKMAVAGLCFIGLSTFAASASAALITNGSFETNTGGGQLGFNKSATGWTVAAPNSSYVFLFTSAAQAVSGVTGQYGNLSLYGPIPSSPDGGAFIGSDPAFQNGPISQTVSGLTVGAQYVLSFNWAGAQQQGFDGATTEGWHVTFGSQSGDAGTIANVNHGFTGWQTASLNFTASSTSQVLSFLATGGPSSSLPPFSLLDGVSLTQVSSTPEPASWGMLLGGLGLLGGMRFTRAKNWFKS